MMHLDRYPPAAGLELDDVRQEIATAGLSGLDPAAAVPVALGLRRLSTGWRSNDPAVAAHLAGCVIDEESFGGAWEQREPVLDTTGLATALIGGTEVVARQSGIGHRAAQLRVKEQLRRFEAGGDLFEGAAP